MAHGSHIVMTDTEPGGMFPSRLFQISQCGTYLIARNGAFTVKDCRTEQRARWERIRWEDRVKREREEREQTVQRWRERSRMNREDKGGPRAHGHIEWLGQRRPQRGHEPRIV